MKQGLADRRSVRDGLAEQFSRDGYLVIEGAFSADEVAAMRAAVDQLAALDLPQRILEKGSSAVRSIYGFHELHPLFGALVRDRRLVEPARELCADEVYVHQTQANLKAAFDGAVWDWHQDYPIWRREDGMPEPAVVNIGLALDPVSAVNGPLLVVPGSHEFDLDAQTAVSSEGREGNLNAKLRHVVSREAIARLADERGLTAVTASPGSLLVFHANILHSSPPNLSPWSRVVLFVRYNAMRNTLVPVENPRPSWVACREPVPIVAVEDFMAAQPEADGAAPR